MSPLAAAPLGRYVTDHALVARFWRSVGVGDEDACWLWLAGHSSSGYGRLYVGQVGGVAQTVSAHRFAYELLVAPIPAGLVIDHLCGEPSCVNPAHLEVVTNAENIRRGDSPSALNARKTTCPHGHPYDHERSGGGRGCRRCVTAQHRARRRRLAARGTPALWGPS